MRASSESLKLLTQGLPIILVICYFLFPKQFVSVSNHALGKTIAILLICLYTYQDMTHGILICLLIILYYHQEVETFLSKSTSEYAEYIPKASKKQSDNQFEGHLEKDFTHVEEAYPNKLPPIKKVGEALFRKEKCHKSRVTCKDQTMKNNVITHVYPELQFRDDECNPCDQTCHFTIKSKQDLESGLAPINTHTTVIEDVMEMFGFQKAEPLVVHKDLVVSEY